MKISYEDPREAAKDAAGMCFLLLAFLLLCVILFLSEV